MSMIVSIIFGAIKLMAQLPLINSYIVKQKSEYEAKGLKHLIVASPFFKISFLVQKLTQCLKLWRELVTNSNCSKPVLLLPRSIELSSRSLVFFSNTSASLCCCCCCQFASSFFPSISCFHFILLTLI